MQDITYKIAIFKVKVYRSGALDIKASGGGAGTLHSTILVIACLLAGGRAGRRNGMDGRIAGLLEERSNPDALCLLA